MVVRAARRRRGRPESSGHPARASQRGVAGAMPVGQGEQNNVAGAVSRATAVTTSPWLGSLKIPPEMWTSRLARSPREARPGEREGGGKQQDGEMGTKEKEWGVGVQRGGGRREGGDERGEEAREEGEEEEEV